MTSLKKLIVKYLREAIERVESDSCEFSDAEAMDLLKLIAHEPLSKEQACDFLNLSRSRFDGLIAEGKLPKGRKRKGWKELCWYRDELEMYRMKGKG